jgi:hypothetical protein
MHKCRACRRPLSSAVSIRYGFGPDCLRRAVKAGTLGIEALTELTSEQRATKQRATRIKPAPTADASTPDLFDHARREAIEALCHAVAGCLACGVTVTYTIEDLR